MSLIDRLFGKAKIMQDNQRGNGLYRVWSQAPKPETVRLPDLYHKTPRLDPVDLIASTIASSPIELFDKNQARKMGPDAKPVEAHPFYELIDEPSKMFPEIDGYALKYITVVLVELLGEAFWVKLRAGSKVTDLLPFPPAWCIQTPTQGNPKFLFQPFGTTASRTIIVEPEDVVWFKQLDATDPYGRGRGRTEAVGGELDADEMAERWQRNYFYNDATPPFWANIPGAPTTDLERMKESWGQRLGGWMNARKPAFTNGENVQITKLGESVKEMDFVESRRYLRDVFLAHYAIPPEMFGIIENSNRSTIDLAYYLFAKNVISRRIGFYERTITRQLIASDYDNRLVAKFDFKVPEDEAFVLDKSTRGLQAGVLTRADWKRANGYPFDASDEVYLMPFSLVEVPKGKTVAEVTAQETPATEPEPENDDMVELPESETEEPESKGYKETDTRKAAHWKAFDNRAKQGEGMFRARVRSFADVQSSKVKKAIESKGPKAYKSALDDTFNGGDEALKHALAPAWIASMTDGSEIARGYLGMKASPSFALYNKLFDEWVKTNGLKKAKEINTTTMTWLLKYLDEELSQAIEAGESIETMTSRLLDAVDGVYDNMSAARAEMIARTETMGSVNFGQQVTYESEGVEKKEWLATMDGDTRDAHEAADGQIVGISESFDVGGESLAYPGDPSGDAGNVINCRCTILPVIER